MAEEQGKGMIVGAHGGHAWVYEQSKAERVRTIDTLIDNVLLRGEQVNKGAV